MRAGTEYDRKGRTGRVVALHGTGDVVEWKELVQAMEELESGIKWGEEDKFNDFSKNNYWQIGWDALANSKGARQAWQNIKNVRVGDYLAFHGYGGSNDLRIYQISKVLDKDEATGKLLLEE